MKRILLLLPWILLAGCERRQPPPAALSYEGLPVQGSLADARHAGFARCSDFIRRMRCRRVVTVKGLGPYQAAVDLLYSDGSGGFRQLTIWSDEDQAALHAVGDLLVAQGWTLCRTAVDEYRGDQEIYTRAASPVRFSIDISYWGKRRLRVLPERGQPTGKCW